METSAGNLIYSISKKIDNPVSSYHNILKINEHLENGLIEKSKETFVFTHYSGKKSIVNWDYAVAAEDLAEIVKEDKTWKREAFDNKDKLLLKKYKEESILSIDLMNVESYVGNRHIDYANAVNKRLKERLSERNYIFI